MPADTSKSSACPCVISIPWLSNAGLGRLEVPDKGEDPQAIGDHDQEVPLCHPLLSVKEVTRPISCPDQQGGPVAVSVECKPRTIGPLVAHRPQHGGAVLIIEHIARVN